ncbi:MAG TPA: CNNM domain-containing protein [Spirochaetota bacterium]|nr:CNNM domain-containing protein [Spirochaetota bacterium]HOM38245.1 CNNM domain-containing protein [Spirochaetota bacterium]HPQ48537.1 CNNM domain-containing protein [Spirochaetota bacterium]
MDPLLIIFLLLSGIFSSSESAFLILKSKGHEFRGIQQKLISDSVILLNTILLSNTVVNIIFSPLSEELAIKYLFFNIHSEEIKTFLSIVFSTVILLIFGESLPKTIGITFPTTIVRFTSFILYPLMFFLYPFTYFLKKFTHIFVKNLKDKEITKHDLLAILKYSHNIGVLKYKETSLIERVINFSHMDIKTLIIPRQDIIYSTLDNTIQDCINIMSSKRFGKLLVCNNVDDIIGFVHIKDVIKIKNPDDKLGEHKEIIRKMIYIPSTKNCIEVLSILKKNRISFGVIIDEFGGTLGLITINKMLDKISGIEIENKLYSFKGNKLILNTSKISLGEVKALLGVDDEWEDEDESVAYFINNKLQKIPKQFDYFIAYGYKWEIERVFNNKIEKIIIKKV